MPGASRFWTRKDSDLVSQHVDMPLEYIKKTLDEKQLHRDQTEAGIVNDDYKMPKNIAWSPEQTAAVDAYNERKKNERLKIQEQFYNSPIDNTNQVASQLLTNRRKTSDEWKEGTGEAWNYQRQYDEYANYAENQKKRLAGKEVLGTDVERDDYLTRARFNEKYKGNNYKNADLNKISVDGYKTESFKSAPELVEKVIAGWKANKNIVEQRDGTFINTDTNEHVSYDEVVRAAQNSLSGDNELQAYVGYKGRQAADLFKYNKPEDWDKQKQSMKDILSKTSNSLFEGAAQEDYKDDVYRRAVDPKTGKFSQEIYDKQRKDDLRYKDKELDNMSDEELIQAYQRHELIDKPIIEGGNKASYVDISRQKIQDQLAVQTMAHQSNSEYDKKIAKEEQEIERRNGIQTNLVGMLGINGKDMPDIDELLKTKGANNFLESILSLGQSDSQQRNAFQTWSKEDKSEQLRKLANTPEGQAKIKEVIHNLTTNFDGAENVFGGNEQEFNQKLQDYIDNSKEKFTSMGESILGFLKSGTKTYNKDREENGWNKIEVADIQNSKITEEIHDQFLGKSVSNFTKDDAPDKLLIGLKRFPGGTAAEYKLYTYTEGEGKDKVTYSHKPYKDMIEALYHTGNYYVYYQLYKINTQV